MSLYVLPIKTAGRLVSADSVASLPPGPCNPAGAVRWVVDEAAPYYWDGTQWITGLPNDAIFDTLTVNTLTVNNISYLNSNVVEIGDNIIELNTDVTGAPTQDGGLCINRGTLPDACLIWDETNDTWTAGIEGSLEPFPGASPAFKFVRQGAVPVDTWLLVDGIPSNLTGHHTPFAGNIKEVFIDSSSASTFQITVYQHDHVTYTALTTVTVTADYGGNFSLTGITFASDYNLAAKLTSGSATDVSVGIRISRS